MTSNIQYPNIDDSKFLDEVPKGIDETFKEISLDFVSFLSLLAIPVAVILVCVYIPLYPLLWIKYKNENKRVKDIFTKILAIHKNKHIEKQELENLLRDSSSLVYILNKKIDNMDIDVPGTKYLSDILIDTRNTILKVNGALSKQIGNKLESVDSNEKKEYLQEIAQFQDLWN